MEGDSTTADEARRALDRIAEERKNKADALACVSGVIQHFCNTEDEVSTERLKNAFNDQLDDRGIENIKVD